MVLTCCCFKRYYKKLATILRLKKCINGLSHDPWETGGDEDPTAPFGEPAAHPSKNAAQIVSYDPSVSLHLDITTHDEVNNVVDLEVYDLGIS